MANLLNKSKHTPLRYACTAVCRYQIHLVRYQFDCTI